MTILLFKWLLVLTFACLIKSDNLINVFAGIVQQTPLNKVAYSNQTRVLFVAGLEGSGHHAFADMMSECERSACSYESKISALSVSYNSTSLATVGLFSGTDGERNDLFISKMLDWMHKLSADAQIKRLHYIGLKDVQLYGGEVLLFFSPSFLKIFFM